MAEDRPDNNAGVAIERVTIAEAAALLGCHPNTVRSRVKAGIYRAEKVHTENGPTWMIDRDSLTTNTPTSARQQDASKVPALRQEELRELARSIVREAGLAHNQEHEDLQRTLDGIFEAGKHLSTLSATALVLVFAAQKLDVVDVDVVYAMITFGLALLQSLICVNISGVVRRFGSTGPAKIAKVAFFLLLTASVTFFIGVLYVFLVPAWRIQGIWG